MRNSLYILDNGIYPSWPIFAKTRLHPVDDSQQRYTKHQEYISNDIERCFGVLKGRLGVLCRNNRRSIKEEVVTISGACEILHIMLV